MGLILFISVTHESGLPSFLGWHSLSADGHTWHHGSRSSDLTFMTFWYAAGNISWF